MIMLSTLLVRRPQVASRSAIRLLWVSATTVPLSLAMPVPAKSDQCGTVNCTDITADYISRVITNIMKDVGVICSSVQTVHLLDKSINNHMMIYHLCCHDGTGVQLYQLIYWARDRELIVDRLTGTFMSQITKKYPFKIGLEER